jgi:hypothetical protein
MGYYPVNKGVDLSSDHLLEKVRQGYSLVVFPESKRSFSNKIGRFHKGAFFLQEQLKLDILPVFLHGNSEVMPKNDFIIYDGSITVIVGKRIAQSDTKYGNSYRERNKKISRLYKREFLKIRNKIETEDYFKKILFSNYIYKNRDILETVKADFNSNKEVYHELNISLPMKSKILHIADDFGQLDILFVAKSIEREITTFIADEQKQFVARNCYTSTHRKVKYISNFEILKLEEFDTVLVNKKSNLLKKILSVGFDTEKEFENYVLIKKIC